MKIMTQPFAFGSIDHTDSPLNPTLLQHTDLAGDALPKVQAPTLLIIGGNDDIVIELNEMARDQMRCEVKLEIVPGATHLFEEPGTLEKVANLASDWFNAHLAAK